MEHDKDIFTSAMFSQNINKTKFVFPINGVQGGVLGIVDNYKECNPCPQRDYSWS